MGNTSGQRRTSTCTAGTSRPMFRPQRKQKREQTSFRGRGQRPPSMGQNEIQQIKIYKKKKLVWICIENSLRVPLAFQRFPPLDVTTLLIIGNLKNVTGCGLTSNVLKCFLLKRPLTSYLYFMLVIGREDKKVIIFLGQKRKKLLLQ